MTNNRDQAPSKRAIIKQAPKNAIYDRKTIYEIIDQAVIATVAISVDNMPFVLPMVIARIGDNIYLHGSRTSRLMKCLAAGCEACISIVHLDGIVVARSQMHCSANYRSVVIHGIGEVVSDEEKPALLNQLTSKIIPGSDNDFRHHLPKELKATSLIVFPLNESACKIRTGGPNDDKEDINLPYWAGEIPIQQVYAEPIPSADLADNIETPDYALNYCRPE